MSYGQRVQSIKQSATDEQLTNVINKIYEDGFQDGSDEGSPNE